MKKIIKLIAVAAVLIVSCTREIEIVQHNNINNLATIAGNFSITKFTNGNSNQDSSADFSGYIFLFTVDGKINAIKNNEAMLGSYKQTPSYNGEAARLGIYFSNLPLSQLNKNWEVNLISDETMHLSNENATSREELEFTAQ